MADFVPRRNDRINPYEVKVGETFAFWDPVKINANGLLVTAVTADTDSLVGVAASDFSSTASVAGDRAGVFDDPACVFEVAADNAAEVLQAEIGDTCDLIVVGGVFKANLGASANSTLKVVQLVQNNDALRDGTFAWGGGDKVLVTITAHQLDG